jgi:hypothetical protein
MNRRGFVSAIAAALVAPLALKAASAAQSHAYFGETAQPGEPTFFYSRVRDYGNLRDIWMITPFDAKWEPRDWTVLIRTSGGSKIVQCDAIAPGGCILVASIHVKHEHLIDVRAV